MKLDSSQLKNVCGPADFTNPKKNLKIVHGLLRTMKKERGMGLAANQCGLNIRLFVMAVGERYFHCFNPEILEISTEAINLPEGCLSFPEQMCQIERPKKIRVRYFSAHGIETVEWLDDWASRCFQHELDHLNGITMFDR